MTFELRFCSSIEKYLKEIEIDEGSSISDKDAKHICHIRALINENEDFLELHALLTEYVNNEISSRLFGFLPFVNDLKRDLLTIIEKPKFNPAKYLRSTRYLTSNSKADIPVSHSINLAESNTTTHVACETRFAKLDSEVNKIKESNVFYKAKSEQLECAITKIQTDYELIKAELNEYKKRALAAEAKVEQLSLTILQKDETIRKLDSEIAKLRSAQMPSTTHSTYLKSIGSP